MGDKSKIEWTDATWNPLRGCTKVSEGCRNCYAAGLAARFSGPGMPYEGLAKMTSHGPEWTGVIKLVPGVLDQPLKWKQPRKIFVNSMSDLFHPNVPDQFIAAVFAIMAHADHHTFQVLTKRPDRMLELLSEESFWLKVRIIAVNGIGGRKFGVPQARLDTPLPNVWLGTSVENQAAADERIPRLLQTPAAVRFLSCEPLLGEVDLEAIPGSYQIEHPNNEGYGVSAVDGIDWAIVGGESGPKARPMHPDWARSLRDQCQSAEVPFFFKQWGEWAPVHELRANEAGIKGKPWHNFDPDTSVCRIGKHSAERLLDGREWNEFPEVGE